MTTVCACITKEGVAGDGIMCSEAATGEFVRIFPGVLHWPSWWAVVRFSGRVGLLRGVARDLDAIPLVSCRL